MIGLPALMIYVIYRGQPSPEEFQRQRDQEIYEAVERHKERMDNS